jgi:hypothetical protein
MVGTKAGLEHLTTVQLVCSATATFAGHLRSWAHYGVRREIVFMEVLQVWVLGVVSRVMMGRGWAV